MSVFQNSLCLYPGALKTGPIVAYLVIGLTAALRATPPAEPTVEEIPANREAAALVEQIEEGIPIGPSQTRQPIRLDLRDSVDQALNQNLGLAIARINPARVREDITIADAAFDPTFTARAGINQNASPLAASTLDGAARPLTENQIYGVGVNQRLTTGGLINLNTGINRFTTNSAFSTINPDYTSEVSLSVRQPLLRGAGQTVNLAPLALAKSSYQQSVLEVRRRILDTIRDTEIGYWNLSAAYALLELRETSLRLAESLLEENKERLRLGIATRADVLQAEADLASRREEIITAQQTIENNQDQLLSLLGVIQFFEDPSIDVEPLPTVDPALPAFLAVVENALAQDLDTQIQYEVIEQRRIDRTVAKDNQRPNLDLTVGGALLGRSDDGFSSYSQAYQREGYRWSAGLELSVPWDLRADRARYRQTQRSYQQASIRLAEIQQELMLRLREAWRALAASKERRISAQASLELNAESFERQRALYDAGLASFRDVLEAQRDLDLAKLRHLQATYDIVRAEVQLARLDGRLLARHGFVWEDIRMISDELPHNVIDYTSQARNTLP